MFSCFLKCLAAASSAATGDLVTTFNFGVNDMVVDPTRNLIYATVPSTNSVEVINASTLSVVAAIPIGSNPMGLALSSDDNTLYVANSGSTAIGVVNLNTLTALPSISTPANPYYLAVGTGGRLYASTGNGIMQFNLGTGSYTSSFSAYPYYYAQLATSPDGKTLFQATEGISPASLFKYDISTATATQVQSIMTSEGGSASPVVTADGSAIIMSNGYTLEKLSTSNLNTVLGTFNVGAYTGPAALSPDNHWLYTTNYNTLEMWNANTFVEKTSFSVPSNVTNSIQIDNSGRLIFVGEDNQLQVFSTGVNDNTATLTLGTLAITQGSSTNVISTTTSGSGIQVTPANGLAAALFSSVSKINVNFTDDNETATFDSTHFSFSPLVTIGGGTSTDSVVIQGSQVVTFTGAGTYGGGTKINSGVLAINSGAALGTGAVTLSTGAELRGIGSVTLNNTVNFASGTTNAIVSAGAGSLFTLNNLDASNTNSVTFGSAGNTGTIILGPGLTLGSNISNVTVAFGTLANGGGLGPLVSSGQVSTTVNAGAILALNDINTTIHSLGGAGAVTLGTKATTVLTLDTTTFGGVMSGAGSVNAAGSLIFTGANTYTGGTTIASGQSITLGQGGTTGSIAGNVSVGSGGLLAFARGDAYSFAGIISGAGGVQQKGPGVLTLTGSNTYTGGTQITSGALAFSNANAFGAGQVTLSTGAELRGSGVVTLLNTVNFASGTTQATISAAVGATFTLNNLDATNTGAVTFGSAGNTGTIALGPGMLNNGNAITVAFGTLRNAGGLTNLASGDTMTVNAGATIALNDLSAEIDTLKGAGSVILGTNATTVLTLNGAVFGGVISGAGSVNIQGSAILTGANTYTGGTTIATLGTAQLGNGGTTGSIMGNVSLSTGGLLLFDRSDAYTFAGVISGAGSVQQGGTGVLTLTGSNTYTGGTQVTSGVLAFSKATAFGTAAVTLGTGAELRGTATVTLNNTVGFASGTTKATLSANRGATLTVKNLDATNTGALTFGSAGFTGTVAIGSGVTLGSNMSALTVAFGTLTNGGGLGQLLSSAQVTTTVNAGATLALGDLSTEVSSLQGSGTVTFGTKAATALTLDSATFGGVLKGAGSVNVNGTAIFTGASTYTGGTRIAANQHLQLGNGTTTGSITGNVSLGAGAELLFDRSNAYSFGGVISGAGDLRQAGAGVLTLTGSNTYSGGTLIDSGVVAFSSAAALGSGLVTLSDGAELRGSGTITLNDAISYVGTDSTHGATISTKGTLTLPNLSIANAAKLNFGSTGYAGTVVIPSGGSLSVNTDARIEVAFGTLRNGGGLGGLTANSQDTRVDTGATIAVNDFSLTVQNLDGTGTVNLGSKATTVLTLAGANFAGTITGAGQLSVPGGNGGSGTGAVVLAKANTYKGGTTVSGHGVLVANNPTGSATGTGAVVINSGATIGGRGSVSGAMTLNSGGTVMPGTNSIGTAGTAFHGSSLLWNGDAKLELQIGSTADELLLSGALTKGAAGTFTIEIDDAGIVAGNYTLATFASTTFSLSDFNLVLPANYTGTLVETRTSLSIQNLQDSVVGGAAMLADNSEGGTVMTPALFQSVVAPETVPEPGSGLLLALGGTALLGWRRRRISE